MPEGWSFFQAKAGKYRLDFMSYEVKKGKGDLGGNPFAEKGELYYERTFWIHRDIGPNKEWHLCAAKTLNQPCPICEYRAKLAKDPSADEQVIKDIAPKERQLFIVHDLGDDENYVWEHSYHLFGKQLDAKIRSGDEDDEYEFFADPESGLTVRINLEQSDRGKWVEATDIEFRARKDQYSDDVVDEMPDLDSMLVATPYDRLKKLFLQTEEDEAADGDDDDAPVDKPKRQRSKDEDKPAKKKMPTADEFGLEEGDEVEYDGEMYEIVRISGDLTSLTLEDSEGATVKGVGPEEVSKAKPKKKAKAEPADDDDEPPKKPSRAKSKKPEPEPEADDDDDWDDDDEDEEPPKKPSKSKPRPSKDEDDEPPKKPKKSKPSKDDDDDWDDWD